MTSDVAMDGVPPSERMRVRRLPKRARYDAATLHAILDEGLVCHLAHVVDGQPFALPTTYARVGDVVYVHGSAASRMLRTLAGGVPVCLTVSLIDGLVLARSAFHHSMNYRSVVVVGVAQEVTDPEEKRRALDALVEHVLPGRAREVRPPSERELKGTLVLRLPLAEASAKVRSGPPLDDPDDMGWPCWAGVLPLGLSVGAPETDPAANGEFEVPEGVRRYRRGGGRPQ